MTALLLATSGASGQNVLTYGDLGEPRTLEPVAAGDDRVSLLVVELMFNGLFSQNELREPVPDLVQDYKVSAEGGRPVYTLHLRQDVRWHDGELFDADDVVASWRIYTDPQSAAAHRPILRAIEKVERADAFTVRITLSKPIFRAFGQMNFKILPKRYAGKGYFDVANAFRASPVGTGPFRFGRRMTDGAEYYFLKNERYYQGPPAIEGVKRRKFLNQTSMVNDLKSTRPGSIDLIPSVRAIDISVLDQLDYVTLHKYDPLSIAFFGFNFRRRLFQDVRVRRALTMATNRREILQSEFQDQGETITGPFPPSSWAYNLTVEDYPYDPEEAKRLLDAAGYRDVDGDKWRDDPQTGKEIELWIKIPNSVSYNERQACTDLVKYLQEVGVRARIDWREALAWKGDVTRGDFDILYDTVSYDDTCDLYPYFYSQGERNYTGYADKKVDGLLAQSRLETDPDRMRALYQQIHRIVHDDCTHLFLWSLSSYCGVKNRATNFKIHPFYFFTFVNQWRLVNP